MTNKKNLGERIPRKGIWGKVLGSSSSIVPSDQDNSNYFDKLDKATKEDKGITIDKASRINPFYEERKKWFEEERIDRNKGTAQEFYDFRKIKKDNQSEWEPKLIKKMDKLKEINGGAGKRYEDIKGMFKLNNNTYEDILYKKNTDISESEIYNAKKYSWYESKNKELNTKLDNKISDWYDNFYGKSSSTDATGRTISPKVSASTLSEPKSLRTPDGYDISKAFDMVADSTSKTANGPTALQTALNSYNFEPKLKVDADIGPKTTSRTKESLMSYGVKDVADRIEKQEQQYKQTKEYEEEEIQRNLDGEIV